MSTTVPEEHAAMRARIADLVDLDGVMTTCDTLAAALYAVLDLLDEVHHDRTVGLTRRRVADAIQEGLEA